MKNSRYLIYYLLTVGGFSLLIWLIIVRSGSFDGAPGSAIDLSLSSGFRSFIDSAQGSLTKSLPLLILQIVTIVAFARIFGYLCTKIGQPSVIGEIIAGIFLGPSVLGALAPGAGTMLFPEGSLDTLGFLSQLGLILFMFIIGMDIDLKLLKTKAPDALVASHASIIIPFSLGMGLAYYLYPEFAPPGVDFMPFALFTGISMSITAFPILARILQERNMLKTRVGVLAITCAAIDDITAWCLLAALIALVKAGSFISALYTVFFTILYVLGMLFIIRPFLHRIGEISARKEGISKPVVAIFILTLLLSSYVTEILGIHAIFGAFIAGAVMPPNVGFRKILIEKIEDLAIILLLPIFFVITGLRTEIGIINTENLWKVTAWVIIIAVAGKFAGSAISLRFVGQRWRDSLIIGALMNTRGLMQIVVLSLGYELGVLSPEIYTIMILMAIVTTLMTGPALDLIDLLLPERKKRAEEKPSPDKFRILISFGNPDSGVKMLRLAFSMIRKMTERSSVTLLHISPAYDLHKYNTDEYERESLKPLFGEAERHGLKVKTIFKSSEDIERDILATANSGHYDLIIAGKAHSLYEGTLLGNMIQLISRILSPGRIIESIKGGETIFRKDMFDGPARKLIKSSRIPVGIFIDNNFTEPASVLVPFYDDDERHLLQYSRMLAENWGSKVKILDFNNRLQHQADLRSEFALSNVPGTEQMELVTKERFEETFSVDYSLLITSVEGWKRIMNEKRLQFIPPAFIIKS